MEESSDSQLLVETPVRASLHAELLEAWIVNNSHLYKFFVDSAVDFVMLWALFFVPKLHQFGKKVQRYSLWNGIRDRSVTELSLIHI